MNIHDKAEFYPIEMIYCVAYYEKDQLRVELLPRQGMDIDELVARDRQYPYSEVFSTTHETIFVVGTWIIDRSMGTPIEAQEVTLAIKADQIRDEYLEWLGELE